MLDFIKENSEKKTKKNDEDYLNAEGLLMCGNCHTAKQITLSGWGTVHCMCKCESEKDEQERAERQVEQDRIMIARMRGEALRDIKLHSHTFANDDGANPALSETARRYAERFEEIRKENCGLLLYGEPGTGKSFYAACIVNALIDRKYSAFMTNVTELTGLCEPVRREEIKRKLSGCDLVVIDDIGSERGTEFAMEQVYAAIDTRYLSGKPLIVTTNYPPQKLMEIADIEHRRIYDRIQEICTPIEVKGVRRKNAGKNRTKTLTEILYGSDAE